MMNKNREKPRLLIMVVMAVGLAIPLTVLGFWLLNLFPFHPGVIAMIGWIIIYPIGVVIRSFSESSYILASSLGLIAEAVALFLILAAWVFLTKNKEVESPSRNKKIGVISFLVVLNILLVPALVGYFKEMRPPLEIPEKILPGKIKTMTSNFIGKTTVDYGQLAFARGKLYVASNIGLIELEGTKVTAVYRWHVHSRIDGVWSGPRSQSLWLQQAVSNSLSTFDDSGWRNIELPKSDRGFTRGDMLRGFNITPVGDDLWFSGGPNAWKWNAKNTTWELFTVPGKRTSYEPVQVYAVSGNLVIIRGANELFGSKANAVLMERTAEDNWNETELQECCVKNLTPIGTDIYFRNKSKELIKISNGKKEIIPSPGKIEALTSMGSDKLIASISDDGVYEYKNKWVKLFDAPYPTGVGDRSVHITANDESIALAVSYYAGDKNNNGLWVFSGSKLVKVVLPD